MIRRHAPRGTLHTVDFDMWDNSGGAVIVVSVRLFAHSGSDTAGLPIYRVAVGSPL